MSFFKFNNYLPEKTDATRRGGERCPHCGKLHFSQSEMDTCAKEHSSTTVVYRCDRCGRTHTSLDAANHCCEDKKRYDRRYDPQQYSSYTYGSGYSDQKTEEKSYSSGGGILDAFFNAGSSNNQSSSSSSESGGFFDSFFNAGGGKNNNGSSSGGSFWPWG